MNRAALLLSLIPALALADVPGVPRTQGVPGGYPFTFQASDTLQSGCVLNALNTTCQASLVGKTTAGFVVTAISSPTGITLINESSRDGTNWDQHNFVDMDSGETTANVPNASIAVGAGKTMILGGGDRFVRIRASTWTSGSATVAVNATDSIPLVTPTQERTSGAVTFGAANAAATVATAGKAGVGFQVISTSTPSGITLVPELSWDGGTTWAATFFDSPTTLVKGASLANAAIVANAAWSLMGGGGATHARVRASAWTSGSFVGRVVANDIQDPSELFSTPTGATSAPPGYAAVAAQDGVTATTMNPVRSAAHNTAAAAATALLDIPAVSRSAVNAVTAGNVSFLSTDSTTGALNVRLTDSTTYLAPQVNAHNTAAPGAGLATMPAMARTAVAAGTAGRSTALSTDGTNGSLNVRLTDAATYTGVGIQAHNGAAATNGLESLPGIARSAVSATTAGRPAAASIDATNGGLNVRIVDSATYLAPSVLANDTTAIANGLGVQPAVARASPTAVTAGRGEMLQTDTATGGVYDVPVATTAAVGTSTGATDVNTTANIKASAGNVYGVSCVNNNASACFLQFYNTAGSPTCGTSVVWSLALPTSGTLNIPPGAMPIANHATGIGVCMGTTRTGATACTTANSCTIFYK
jgi:hypothetical protein